MRQSSGQNQSIQIQEPTLKDFKKRGGWLTGSCLTGSGCIVLFIGAIYLAFRLLTGNGPVVVTKFPTDFPKDIPRPSQDNIIRIVEIQAGIKSRALWIATTVPRVLTAPILAELNPDAKITTKTDSLGRITFVRTLERDDYLAYAKIPTGAGGTKSVSATWNGVKSTPQLFIEAFEKELKSGEYIVIKDRNQNDTDDHAEISFSKGKTSGLLRAIDMKPDEPGIEYVQLIVNY